MTTPEEVKQPQVGLVKKVIETGKRGLNFLWKDLTKTHLIWVKIIFFLQSASLVTLYPYLVRKGHVSNFEIQQLTFFLQTIHLKSLGFTIEDASLVNSVIPLADVFGPPLAGYFADKLGNFRLFMAFMTFLNGASSLLLLAVPTAKSIPV